VIERHASPERRARFEVVFDESYEPLLAYAHRRVGADADDVVAATYAVAWRRLEDVPSDPLPWLYGVARKVISDQRRAARRREALAEQVRAHSEREPDTIPQLRPPLFAALARLSSADREAILLVAWEELSAEQAAKAMGCSTTAFRVRLHRARRRLRQHLSELDCGSQPGPSSLVAKEVKTT
jgi:RNA polymerase sigma-70 factor (ECF subfamily)